MPTLEEAPPSEQFENPCEELIVYGPDLDTKEAQEIVDELILPEFEEAQRISAKPDIRALTEATIDIIDSSPLPTEQKRKTAVAAGRLVEAARKGEIAEGVMTLRGCDRCIKSGACPLRERLLSHTEAREKAKTVLEKLHQEAVRVRGLQELARSYGQWSVAKTRIENSPAIEQGSDLKLANATRRKFLDTLISTPNSEDRDKIIEEVYGFIPDKRQRQFSDFINGIATELYVYEDLERAAGKLPFRVRLTEAKEDIESGTDIMVIVQDKESKDREIPVDAKSWGAFSKLVDKGEVRQLDRAGYFGIKENRQHQEVLVINPAGLNESQGLYSKEKIGNTNCHSFRRASNDNRFATATYHAIQRHMLPEQSSNRVFSATF